MTHDNEIPFSELLNSLFTDKDVSIPLLFRLSDMSEAELAEFNGRWSTVETERRRVIIRHLADISEENFVVDFSPVFARCLTDSEAPVRLAALDGVWDTTDITFVKPIIQLMQSDESGQVQAAAASALAHYVLMAEWGELPKKVATPIVDALLAKYDEPETALPIRRAALEALGAADHPRVASLISEAYENENVEMQLSAVFAMGNSADKRWLAVIFSEMENPIDDMRAEAARAAGAIGSSDAIPNLAELTHDENLDVRLAAVTALGAIGGDLAREILTDLYDDLEAEALHEVIEAALEEMDWFTGEFDLLSLNEADFEENGNSPT